MSNSEKLFPVGTRVQWEGLESEIHEGTVVGCCIKSNLENTPQLLYIVETYPGFWTSNDEQYITNLVVDSEILYEVEVETENGTNLGTTCISMGF